MQSYEFILENMKENNFLSEDIIIQLIPWMGNVLSSRGASGTIKKFRYIPTFLFIREGDGIDSRKSQTIKKSFSSISPQINPKMQNLPIAKTQVAPSNKSAKNLTTNILFLEQTLKLMTQYFQSVEKSESLEIAHIYNNIVEKIKNYHNTVNGTSMKEESKTNPKDFTDIVDELWVQFRKLLGMTYMKHKAFEIK